MEIAEQSAIALDPHWNRCPASRGLSRTKDRTVKAALYPSAGVPEYWIVDLVDEVVEMHLGPEAGRYARVERRGRNERIAPTSFPDVVIAVGNLLP